MSLVATDTPTPRLDFDRCVTAIVEQTRMMGELLVGPDVDLRAAVGSCPGWNLAQLTAHVGEELRWLEGMVRTRATTMADDTAMRDLDPEPARDAVATGRWIADGGVTLADALTGAGPDAPVWNLLPGLDTAAFYARRFAHEQLMHRIDAVLALDAPLSGVPDDQAADALAEWMELGARPEMLTFHPHRRDLVGPGRTILVAPTDATAETWLVDLTGSTGQALVHRPASPDEPAAVTLRGPLVELLLVIYARRPLAALDVVGDRELAASWLERVGFA